MKYLPYENFKIKTKLSSKEIIDRLKRDTYKIDSAFARFDCLFKKERFCGKVDGSSFKIRRNIKYGNSFLPMIFGKIEDNGENRVIYIKMRMHIFTTIFMLIWFLILFLIGTQILIKEFSSNGLNFSSLIPVAMLLFGYLLVMFGFKFESKKAKNILEEILESKG